MEEESRGNIKMNNEVSRILKTVKDNIQRRKYTPFSEEESKLVRDFYASLISLPIDGGDVYLYNEDGTLISKGYDKIIIWDYGPYIQSTKEKMVLDSIKQKWPGSPKSGMKYVWMETTDNEKTKVCYQLNKVPHALYEPGKYYIDPRLVFYCTKEEWSKKCQEKCTQ